MLPLETLLLEGLLLERLLQLAAYAFQTIRNNFKNFWTESSPQNASR